MIKGKRALLANMLFQSRVYRSLRPFDSKSLVIFNYHRIRDESHTSAPFDDGVFGPTQEMFRSQIQWLKHNSDIISESELLDHVHRRKKLRRSSVMITFDDGYRDNAELALPILSELKVPATFFISTSAIENREVGWWDAIAYLIKKTKKRRFVLNDELFDLTESKERSIRKIQEYKRTQKAEKTENLIQELAISCDVELPDFETGSKEIMSWDQVKESLAAGITIGSHTHSHRVLSTLSLADQFEEFRLSKEILERELKVPIRSIAYPVGGETDCHHETAGLAQKCGYELGFSFQTGANRLERLNPFRIGRISAEESIPLTCAAITLPSIFARSRYRVAPALSMSSFLLTTPNQNEGTT